MTEYITEKPLSVRQQKALQALLITPTIRKASELSGVPEDTISRWKNKDARFKRAYQAAALEVARQTGSDALRAAPHFWNRLLYLSSNAKSEAVQLGATAEGLRIIYRLLEMMDIETRLAVLEERYAQDVRR